MLLGSIEIDDFVKTNSLSSQQYLYGGISGVKLSTEYFDLGEGVEIRQTFAGMVHE